MDRPTPLESPSKFPRPLPIIGSLSQPCLMLWAMRPRSPEQVNVFCRAPTAGGPLACDLPSPADHDLKSEESGRVACPFRDRKTLPLPKTGEEEADPPGGGAGLWDSALKALCHRHPRRPRAGGTRWDSCGTKRQANVALLRRDRAGALVGRQRPHLRVVGVGVLGVIAGHVDEQRAGV